MPTDTGYLIKSKRARVLAAVAVAVAALVCSWLVYGLSFDTANDTASLERAVSENVCIRHRVDAEVLGTLKSGRWLTVFYRNRTFDCQGVGFALFKRGLNLRYSFVSGGHMSPIYSGFVTIRQSGFDDDVFLIAGYNVSGVDSFGIRLYSQPWLGGRAETSRHTAEAVLPVEYDRFLTSVTKSDLNELAGVSSDYVLWPGSYASLYDSSGRNITESFFVTDRGIRVSDPSWNMPVFFRITRYFFIFVIVVWGVIIARFMLTAKHKDFESDGRAEFMEIADIYKLKNNKGI